MLSRNTGSLYSASSPTIFIHYQLSSSPLLMLTQEKLQEHWPMLLKLTMPDPLSAVNYFAFHGVPSKPTILPVRPNRHTLLQTLHNQAPVGPGTSTPCACKEFIMDETNMGYLADESGVSSSERATPEPKSPSQSPRRTTAPLTTESLQIHNGYQRGRRNGQPDITARKYPSLPLPMSQGSASTATANFFFGVLKSS
jgi:hypothetical protein